jgi:hypothetical protein
MRALIALIALTSLATLAGCDSSSAFSLEGCHAELQRGLDAGGREVKISWTEEQLGWVYDNGSGTFKEHLTDYDWSSGMCVVTNPPPGLGSRVDRMPGTF